MARPAGGVLTHAADLTGLHFYPLGFASAPRRRDDLAIDHHDG